MYEYAWEIWKKIQDTYKSFTEQPSEGIVVVDGIYCGKRRENRGYNKKRWGLPPKDILHVTIQIMKS